DGVLQQLDTPQTLYDEPANLFVAGFIGSPAMNFLDGTVRKTESGIAVEEGQVLMPLEGNLAARLESMVNRPVTVGLRPEYVTGRNEATRFTVNLPVDVVEPLGSDVYVTFKAGDQAITG